MSSSRRSENNCWPPLSALKKEGVVEACTPPMFIFCTGVQKVNIGRGSIEIMEVRKNLVAIRKKIEKDELLFDLVCIGGAALAVSMPYLAPVAIFVKVMQKHRPRYSDRQLRNAFYQLRKKGLLKVKAGRGRTELYLSDEAIKKAQYFDLLHKAEAKRKGKWNGRWFMIMFDVENGKTPARNAFRFFIKKMGFAKLQQSVWIFPFSCEEEIVFLKDFFGLSNREVCSVEDVSLGNDERFRRIFSLV